MFQSEQDCSENLECTWGQSWKGMTVKVSAAAHALIHSCSADYCPIFPYLDGVLLCLSIVMGDTKHWGVSFLFLPFGRISDCKLLGGKGHARPQILRPLISLAEFPIRSRARTNVACTLHPMGDTGKARCEFLRVIWSQQPSTKAPRAVWRPGLSGLPHPRPRRKSGDSFFRLSLSSPVVTARLGFQMPLPLHRGCFERMATTQANWQTPQKSEKTGISLTEPAEAGRNSGPPLPRMEVAEPVISRRPILLQSGNPLPSSSERPR